MSSMEKTNYAEDIATHLKERFGLTVHGVETIDKGWILIKWRMNTDDGPRFVKFYHPDRYQLNARPDRRHAMDKRLHLQGGLNLAGIPAPKVYLHDGHAIHETSSGLLYTLQSWTDGATLPAGSYTVERMASLGDAAGRMHRWLADVPRPDKQAWKPDKIAYLAEWQNNWNQAAVKDDTIVMEWLARSRRTMESMDFGLFESSPTGWLHWDLWTDNLLFGETSLAGIVDFDRMAFAYPEIDVARAVLSGALRNGELRLDAVHAFMESYRAHWAVPSGLLSRAMRMIYVIESLWWFRTEVREESELRGLLRRFIEEIQWIEDRMEDLSELLEGW